SEWLAAAENSLQQAGALGADPQAVRYWLGRGRAVAGAPQEAQHLLEASVATLGAREGLPAADLSRALGIALRREGLAEQALQAFQSALQREGDPSLSYLELGLTHAAHGDHPAAAAALRRAIAAQPDLPEAHF